MTERHGAAHKITVKKAAQDPNNMAQVKGRPLKRRAWDAPDERGLHGSARPDDPESYYDNQRELRKGGDY